MHYRNYTLTLSQPVGQGYPLRAEAESGAPVSCLLPLPGDELQGVAARLSDAQRSAGQLRDAGGALFRWLFSPATEADFRKAWESAERKGEGLRLRLAIAPPELGAWPWELLHDPLRNHTFALSPATPLVRYMPLSAEPCPAPDSGPPINLLLVLPAAPDLNLAAEHRHLDEVAAALGGSLQVRVLDGVVTRADLADALLMGEYEILHFGGHGAWTHGKGYVALNRPDGEEDWLEGEQLARLLSGFRSLRLVVLNACHTGAGDDGRGFGGVAGWLAGAGVPAVVAMQLAIGDAPAATFTREFYKRLLAGEDGGRADVALAHARTMLAVLHSGSSWAAPVLHSGLSDSPVLAARGAMQAAFDPIIRRAQLAALARSLETSGGHEEDWVLAPRSELHRWRDQLVETVAAYRQRHATAGADIREAAAAGLALAEGRLAAVERALRQAPSVQ